MTEVGIRALKQNASAVVASAVAGETVWITDRGRLVAQLSAAPASALERLRVAGRVREPRRAVAELGAPLEMPADVRSASDTLADMRDAERY